MQTLSKIFSWLNKDPLKTADDAEVFFAKMTKCTDDKIFTEYLETLRNCNDEYIIAGMFQEYLNSATKENLSVKRLFDILNVIKTLKDEELLSNSLIILLARSSHGDDKLSLDILRILPSFHSDQYKANILKVLISSLTYDVKERDKQDGIDLITDQFKDVIIKTQYNQTLLSELLNAAQSLNNHKYKCDTLRQLIPHLNDKMIGKAIPKQYFSQYDENGILLSVMQAPNASIERKYNILIAYLESCNDQEIKAEIKAKIVLAFMKNVANYDQKTYELIKKYYEGSNQYIKEGSNQYIKAFIGRLLQEYCFVTNETIDRDINKTSDGKSNWQSHTASRKEATLEKTI